jgi:hypothetical protein
MMDEHFCDDPDAGIFQLNVGAFRATAEYRCEGGLLTILSRGSQNADHRADEMRYQYGLFQIERLENLGKIIRIASSSAYLR